MIFFCFEKTFFYSRGNITFYPHSLYHGTSYLLAYRHTLCSCDELSRYITPSEWDEYESSLRRPLYSHHTSRIYLWYLVCNLYMNYYPYRRYSMVKSETFWQNDDRLYRISVSKRTTNRRSTLSKPSSLDDTDAGLTREFDHHGSWYALVSWPYRIIQSSQSIDFDLYRMGKYR